MTNYAFIFARGGSKGLPGKNVLDFGGKPLIAHSIELALSIKEIKKVFVSTEDKGIAKISMQYGAEIIKRPAELARDDSPEWLAWKHAVNYVKSTFGDFNCFISLPATSPLRSVEDVLGGLALFNKNHADICVSMKKAERHPMFNLVRRNDNGFISLYDQNGSVNRRQDAPKAFDLTTVLYICNASFIENNNRIFDGNVVAIEIPKERAVDIDDLYDFKFAESLYFESMKNE